MGKVVVVDDLLSTEQCNECIHYHYPERKYMDNEVCDIIPSSPLSYIVQDLFVKCQRYFDEHIQVGWAEVVRWPKDSFMGMHYDLADEKTVVSSVTYLNDNYDGGDTVFEDLLEIKPKVGRTIFFHGVQYRHGVSRVIEGQRYTLPVWYNRVS